MPRCSLPDKPFHNQVRRGPCPRQGDVLNASRHHGKADLRGPGNSPHLHPVLNASRHHGKGDRQRELRFDGATKVLNASRHHGKGDFADDPNTTAGLRCSTPLGITARGTPRASRTARISSDVCSTPLGITARGTPGDDAAASARRLVLNASRHHGKGDKRLPPDHLRHF